MEDTRVNGSPRSEDRRRWTAGFIALIVPLVFAACSDGNGDSPQDTAGSSGVETELAGGKELFEATCASCHGEDLNGTSTGPPFLSPIYAPDHHPDESFYAAVANGVQPHHWEFGPMPAQPAVSQEDVAAIIAYVREQQQAAGITEDPNH